MTPPVRKVKMAAVMAAAVMILMVEVETVAILPVHNILIQ